MFGSNNYFDYMKNMNSQDFFSKQLQSAPFFDLSAMAQSTKENADAMTSAGQILSENSQVLFKRFSDAAQKNADDMMKSLQEAIATGDIESLNQKQKTLLKSAIESNLKNTREALDISTKSTLEVLDIISNSLKSGLNKSFATKEKSASKK